MLDPHSIHPQRDLVSLCPNAKNFLSKSEFLLLRNAHPFSQGVKSIQRNGL